MINFSIPIVCYLKHLLSKNLDYSKYWISNIYKSSGEFIGHRTLFFDNNIFTITTKNDKKDSISVESISSFDDDHLDTRIHFMNKNIEISKFYQVIDNSILECVTTKMGGDILSFETLTTEPIKSTNNLWNDISQHHEWFCILKDSNHNEIGNRRIYIYNDYSFIDTEFNHDEKSQYECLRLVNKNLFDKFGSNEKLINHFKILDSDSKTHLSNGGIIIDSYKSIDEHKKIVKKFKN